MDIKNLIRNKRIEYGYTMKELASKVGVSEGTVSRWESGEIENIRRDKIKALSDVLGISPALIMGWPTNTEDGEDTEREFTDREVNLIRKYRMLDTSSAGMIDAMINACIRAGMRLYPYYHHIAAAGTGFYFEDIPVDTIEAPEMTGADFIIGVSGDSMEPTYSDGDDLYVQRAQRIRTGEIGIFLVDGTCLVKELGPDGLMSHNPSYKTIDGTSNIRCVGRVLGRVKT